MANKINDQRLFEYIDSIGPAYGVKSSLYIFDNTGPRAEGGKSYRCFLKGGICFEIHKERTTAPDWEYWLDIVWSGPFEAMDSTDIIATLLWLKHPIGGGDEYVRKDKVKKELLMFQANLDNDMGFITPEDFAKRVKEINES